MYNRLLYRLFMFKLTAVLLHQLTLRLEDLELSGFDPGTISVVTGAVWFGILCSMSAAAVVGYVLVCLDAE